MIQQESTDPPRKDGSQQQPQRLHLKRVHRPATVRAVVRLVAIDTRRRAVFVPPPTASAEPSDGRETLTPNWSLASVLDALR